MNFMPRSIVKGTFVDAFLSRMKNRFLFGRKIWSRRSSILPEFVDCSVLIYNGKTPVRCKITEGKVGHKFGEFASTRRRRPSRTNKVNRVRPILLGSLGKVCQYATKRQSNFGKT